MNTWRPSNSSFPIYIYIFTLIKIKSDSVKGAQSLRCRLSLSLDGAALLFQRRLGVFMSSRAGVGEIILGMVCGTWVLIPMYVDRAVHSLRFVLLSALFCFFS